MLLVTLLLLTVLPSTAGAGLRRGRLGDVAETIALVGLLPLLVVAGGVLPRSGA